MRERRREIPMIRSTAPSTPRSSSGGSSSLISSMNLSTWSRCSAFTGSLFHMKLLDVKRSLVLLLRSQNVRRRETGGNEMLYDGISRDAMAAQRLESLKRDYDAEPRRRRVWAHRPEARSPGRTG